MALPELSFRTDDLVRLNFEVRLDDLGKILQSLSTAVSNCTKRVSELGTEVFQLRQGLQNSQERTREGFLQEEVNRERLRGQLEKVKDDMRKMETTYITVKEFDGKVRMLHQSHQTLSDRLTETETTGGKKIISHIESFVRRHVREWYEPVRAEETKDLLGRLADLQGHVFTTLRGESAALDERQTVKVGELSERTSNDLNAAVAVIDKQTANIIQTRDTDMAQINSSVRALEEAQKKAVKELAGRTQERFTEVDARVSSLYYGQYFNEEDFREIYDEYTKFRQAPGTESSLHELVDRRVDLLHNTRPFLEIRAKMQRDIGAKLAQVKEEDQEDFARQITEIQRELRSKVHAQRVVEIVKENTDQALYESVDYIKARVHAIEDDKVSQDAFIEALRSKGDLKVLEAKADRVLVTQLFDFLRARLETLTDKSRSTPGTAELPPAQLPAQLPAPRPDSNQPAFMLTGRPQSDHASTPEIRAADPAAVPPQGVGHEFSSTGTAPRQLSGHGSAQGLEQRHSSTEMRQLSGQGIEPRQRSTHSQPQRQPTGPTSEDGLAMGLMDEIRTLSHPTNIPVSPASHGPSHGPQAPMPHPAASPMRPLSNTSSVLGSVRAGVGIIDAALNPQPEYQWGSEATQRQGMPPSRTKGAAAGRRGKETPSSAPRSGGSEPRSATSPKPQRITADDTAAADSLPALGEGTRAQEAYVRAVARPEDQVRSAVPPAPPAVSAGPRRPGGKGAT